MLINNGVNPDTNATVIPASVLETVTSGITVWPSDVYVMLHGIFLFQLSSIPATRNFLCPLMVAGNTKATIEDTVWFHIVDHNTTLIHAILDLIEVC